MYLSEYKQYSPIKNSTPAFLFFPLNVTIPGNDFCRLYSNLNFVSNKIINSIKGINRVVYDITSKPPSTIELE